MRWFARLLVDAEEHVSAIRIEIRARIGQDLDEAAVERIAGVDGPEDALGVIPAVLAGVLTIAPCPRLRGATDTPGDGV